MKKLACILFLCFVLNGCARDDYSVPLHQDFANTVSVELLDCHDCKETVIYTLNESEIPEFGLKLKGIGFAKYFNDPATEYGMLAVRIIYADGYVDTIGMDINSYRNPEGKNLARDGWYCVANDEDYYALFLEYVDKALLPDS